LVTGLPTGSTIVYFPAQKITVGGNPAGAQINVTLPDDNAIAGDYTITVTASSSQYNF